ncbi:MAG: hypothetical protein HC913_10415 [Microscillaceae bacterium]|nr:hypothetical protein [Microscillaceae bacterium]
MEYSFNQLTTVADCDALLALAGKEKADLEFKQLSLRRSRDSYLERSTQLNSDIQVGESELAALNTVIAGLPEGEIKEDNENRRTRLQFRLFTLNESLEKYGSVALLEKEMEMGLVEKQLEELQLFITALENRKASL